MSQSEAGSATSRGLPLTLLWVELTTDSTAAGAHLRGTLQRLTDPRFAPRTITTSSEGPGWVPGIVRKAWRIASVVARARMSRPDGVLLARWSPFVAFAARSWRKRGLPLVLFVQGNLDDMYDSNPWTRRVPSLTDAALASIRDAARVVTPSEGLADWAAGFRADGRASITVIPNGVDVSLFAAEREVGSLDRDGAGTEPPRPHALFFGNLATWQGVDTILEALADPAWPEDLGLRVIGDGRLAEAVRTSPDPRVEYLGRLSKRQVAREAARAELTLATRHDVAASATGVSPFKILESAAAGTPSVVTRVPGQTELAVDLGGSLLIPADDPHALAEAVARLHLDPELRARLGADGLAGVASYDWAARADELSTVVLQAAGLEASDHEAGRRSGRNATA